MQSLPHTLQGEQVDAYKSFFQIMNLLSNIQIYSKFLSVENMGDLASSLTNSETMTKHEQ